MIKVDENRQVTEEEYGYYWTWSDEDPQLRVYFKGEVCTFYKGSVYIKLQETPPEKPEPIEQLDDGVYKLQWLNSTNQDYRYLEKRGDMLYKLNGVFYTVWEPKRFKVVAKLVEEEISD